MAEISIIVPVYNKEKYIGNFIKSVINQSYKDFELILVNDGSTDNSMEVAERILKNIDINYKMISKKNGGQSSARNLGIREANGNWLVLLDSDDCIQKDYLKIMHNEAIKNNVDVVICDINEVKEDKIFEESVRTNEKEIKTGKDFFADFIMHRISIGPYSLMIKKEYIDKINVKFDEKSQYSEEFTFITQLLYQAENVVHIKEKIYNYCLRDGSVSTGANIDKILNGYKQIQVYSEIYKKNENKYDKMYNKYALPRWILATARFTAKNLPYKEYKELMTKLKAKNQIKCLFTFPEIKTKMAAILFAISMPVFYKICKK